MIWLLAALYIYGMYLFWSFSVEKLKCDECRGKEIKNMYGKNITPCPTPYIIGAIVSPLWPIITSIILVNKLRNWWRRDSDIEPGPPIGGA